MKLTVPTALQCFKQIANFYLQDKHKSMKPQNLNSNFICKVVLLKPLRERETTWYFSANFFNQLKDTVDIFNCKVSRISNRSKWKKMYKKFEPAPIESNWLFWYFYQLRYIFSIGYWYRHGSWQWRDKERLEWKWFFFLFHSFLLFK